VGGEVIYVDEGKVNWADEEKELRRHSSAYVCAKTELVAG